MEELRAYINGLPPNEQVEFAERCETTIGYLRKALATKQRLGIELCIRLQRESGGVVRCEDVRPDVDWADLRAVLTTGPAAPATEHVS